MDNLGPGCLSTETSKGTFISTLGIENNKSYNQKNAKPRATISIYKFFSAKQFELSIVAKGQSDFENEQGQ